MGVERKFLEQLEPWRAWFWSRWEEVEAGWNRLNPGRVECGSGGLGRLGSVNNPLKRLLHGP